ncbi:hypothetical protein F5X68DRAFT_241865 [Plectosphaerella plurivora]|uniref:ZZ-type domain-containing protein n=1 Tax=Plectosphaerella plurivora TaxID=936078 RepID=A0A9P8V8A3_9PEZI|nr:hypothetical protein F5X68DRAFT_241865 [Plectosphaerella plurivora]
MAISDFFSFDEDEYRYRISSYATSHLKRQEVVKLRQCAAAGCTIGTSLVAAPATGGVSFVVTCIGARQFDVAERKLRLIQEELESRIIILHEPRVRDVLLPIILTSVVGGGAGIGVEHLVTDITTTGIDAPLARGTAVSEDEEDGYDDRAIDVSRDFAVGEAAAALAAPVASLFVGDVIEAPIVSCLRAKGALWEVLCDHCARSIKGGMYWHCSRCGDFDLCQTCYLGGKNCKNNTHTLITNALD